MGYFLALGVKIESGQVEVSQGVEGDVTRVVQAAIRGDLGETDGALWPHLKGAPRLKLVTVEMLLAHSSGLPAYAKLFEQAGAQQSLVRMALQVPLEQSPGDRAKYSDIGFIILGAALERTAMAIGKTAGAISNKQ